MAGQGGCDWVVEPVVAVAAAAEVLVVALVVVVEVEVEGVVADFVEAIVDEEHRN